MSHASDKGRVNILPIIGGKNDRLTLTNGAFSLLAISMPACTFPEPIWPEKTVMLPLEPERADCSRFISTGCKLLFNGMAESSNGMLVFYAIISSGLKQSAELP